MFAEVLVQLGVLKPEAIEAARLRQELTSEDLDEAILAMQLLSEREMLRALARQLSLQYLTTEKVADLKIADEVLERVPVRIAESLTVMPFRLNPDGTLWVLAAVPLPAEQIEQLRRVSEARAVSQILARKRAIRAAHRRHYYRDPHAFQSLEEQELVARLAPPVGDLTVETAPHFTLADTPTRVDRNVVHANTPRVMSVLPEQVAALQRENERLKVAQSLAAVLASVQHLDLLASELLAAMLDLFTAEVVGFALTGDHGAPLLLESRRRAGERADAQTLEISSTIIRTVVNSERPLLVLDAQADERFSRENSIVARKVRSVVCAPIRARAKVYGALYLEAHSPSAFDGEDLAALGSLATVTGGAVEAALARQRLEDEIVTSHTLRRFLPKEEVDAALSGGGPSLLPLEAEATLLVAQVQNVAALVDGAEPDEAMRRVDLLVDALTQAVFEHGGTVQGEHRGGIAAVFGPPRAGDEHADRAVAAAVQMAQRAVRGDVTAGQELMIGLASGRMVLGAAGPLTRLQFLAMGETCELAYALAARAAPGDILGTTTTRDQSSRFFTWVEHGAPVNERGEPRPVFRLRWR